VSQVRTLLLVLACAIAAVGAADAATSPRALRAAILRAELAQQSVHYVTATSQAGQRVRDVADVARDRGIQRFTVFPKSGKTGHLTVLLVHSTAYMHGDAFALHALGFPTPFAAHNAGKWVSIARNSPPYPLVVRNVTLGSLARDVVPGNHLSLVNGTVGGRAVRGLRGTAPKGGTTAPEGGILTTYVPESGPPLPVEGIEFQRGSHVPTGRVTFSRWNEPVHVQAPTHSVPIH
jgi:hypothetical protein